MIKRNVLLGAFVFIISIDKFFLPLHQQEAFYMTSWLIVQIMVDLWKLVFYCVIFCSWVVDWLIVQFGTFDPFITDNQSLIIR